MHTNQVEDVVISTKVSKSSKWLLNLLIILTSK